MRMMKMNTTIAKSRLLLVPVVMLFAATVYASAPKARHSI